MRTNDTRQHAKLGYNSSIKPTCNAASPTCKAMITSLRDWYHDQLTTILQPLIDHITADMLNRLRIDITIRLSIDDQ